VFLSATGYERERRGEERRGEEMAASCSAYTQVGYSVD
jgi:hypothetical protein